MRNGSNVNKAASWILAFICSLVLVMAVAIGIIKFTLFNPSYMGQVADKVNYEKTMANEINEAIMDLGRGSSVPPKVLKNVVKPAMVQEDFKNYIKSIYNDNPNFKTANQEIISKKVIQAVTDYADEINQTLDDETLNNINVLGKEASTRYNDIIVIPYLGAYAKKVLEFSNELWVFLAIMLGIFILLLLGGLSLSSRLKHRKLRYVAMVFNGSGLMLLVFPSYLYFSKIFYRLGIGSKALYDFLTTYVNDFILRFIWAGLICMIIGIILFLLSEYRRKKLIHG